MMNSENCAHLDIAGQEDLLADEEIEFEVGDTHASTVVNHVMSRDIPSGIFEAIFGYFKRYSPPWVVHKISIEPLVDADIFHFHRPQLESSICDRSVCTVHHDLDDPDRWHSRHRFIPRYLESEAIICLNTTQRDILEQEGVDVNKLHVIPHGYNHELLKVKPRMPNPDGSRVVLGLASRRYGRRVKGEAYLMDLVKRLDPAVFEFILVGQDRSLDAMSMRSLGFDVQSFDRLPYRVFQGFYESIDALLMCSSHEGGPANIPEALATGTPILSSRIGMASDMINDGENGFFLSLDPDADAARILHVTQGPDSLLKKAAVVCNAAADDVPTWAAIVEKNINVYGRIIGRNLLSPPITDLFVALNLQEGVS